MFVDRREASGPGTAGPRDAGGQTGKGPAGYGRDFRFYSRDRGKPLVGHKQGQDMV